MTRKPGSWKEERQEELRRLEPPLQASAERAFDPENASDCRVLRVSTKMLDHQFETIDDTEYIVTVENASEYYLALNVKVQANLALTPVGDESSPGDTHVTPDGDLLIELIPDEQYIECLKPKTSKPLHFRAISRGAKVGCYRVNVVLDYSIVYWDGRPATLRRTFLLPVGVPPEGIIRAGTRPLRQPDSETNRGKENEHE